MQRLTDDEIRDVLDAAGEQHARGNRAAAAELARRAADELDFVAPRPAPGQTSIDELDA